jgi:hypothetical protein
LGAVTKANTSIGQAAQQRRRKEAMNLLGKGCSQRYNPHTTMFLQQQLNMKYEPSAIQEKKEAND